MAIQALRILPPIAIGRLGSSAIPLEAFDLEIPPDRPLDFRRIVPKESFLVDLASGKLTAYTPKNIRFKDGDQIRPVAPFLEVFAITDAQPNALVPLTLDLLHAEKLSVADLHWDVTVANIKIFRRTKQDADKITAGITNITKHQRFDLQGKCDNFLDNESRPLPLGYVQFIEPTDEFPQIRLRFTPAEGKVYGASRERHTPKGIEPDPIISCDERVLYNAEKGTWRGYSEQDLDETDPNNAATLTNPGRIFAGYRDKKGTYRSWGYLDDECDGFVQVTLKVPHGKSLIARAIIGAGPPTFAPDTLPPRVVSDEIEQILLGPKVDDPVPIEAAQEIIRRALETVRLMNTAVMNGNAINGRENIASTMVRQDTGDFGRLFEPIMAATLVDQLAVLALHERVYNALSSGAAPWFSQVLRRPEEIGDLSNAGRRKMPALMRNADGRALTLTHRQIDTVIKAAAGAMFDGVSPGTPTSEAENLQPRNRTAQLHHRGTGNPFSVLPRTAISNCFPGLEFDFRNLWRRAFVGLVLLENSNIVVKAEDPKYQDLVGRRLLRVDGKSVTVKTTGPDNSTLSTRGNPNAVSFMEWSNVLAHVLSKKKADESVDPEFTVNCEFTAEKPATAPGEPSTPEVVWNKDLPTKKVDLKVRQFFEDRTASVAADVLYPGELTQGLCSPWQNDYRECACYYWAASRPDYVNVEPGTDGLSHGDMWLAKKRTGEYIPDDRTDKRLVSYDDLFKDWEKELQFIIRGKDAVES